MNLQRATRPRQLGLLTGVDPGVRAREKRRFPYAVGDRIAGDLTVIGHLAVGRLGHLYQVWSASEWCAYTCKILAPEHRDDARAVTALRREGRILRGLQHPNILRIYSEGEHDGLPFLLMEYAEGPTIFDLLEERTDRRLDVTDALRTAIHIGAGLYHTHRSGFLHLDLKPANLLLRGSVPLLVDFDAARRAQPRRRPRKLLGTAPYMAPEQVRQEAPTTAADVYGLGAVLYEMVTGRWPFEDVYLDPSGRSGSERDYPQLGASPPPPASRFQPDLPRDVDDLIARCLHADPTRRPQSLHPVLLAVSAALEEPVAFWPAGVETERRRTPRH
ncbi:MAG: serine/threonine-protein kinase [Longimicrobiales bacterium]